MRSHIDEREAFFDSLSEDWDNQAPPPDAVQVKALMEVLQVHPRDRVLDVGSGTGALLAYLLPLPVQTVVACDISERMLARIAGKFPSEPRLKLVKADAKALPFDAESFDVILCHGVFPHFGDKTATLRELHRVAAPNARLAISHFSSRGFVNHIHSGLTSQIIRHDILPPASEVKQMVEASGFVVTETVDSDSAYLVGAVKR